MVSLSPGLSDLVLSLLALPLLEPPLPELDFEGGDEPFSKR